MDTIITVAVTLFIYWAVGMGIFFATGENDTFAAFWCMGLLYWIVYVLFTPFRLLKHYFIRRGR